MLNFSNPREIINELSIPEDAHIADFGSGSGTYTFLLADGYPMRKIFAIDVRREMVDVVQNEAERRGLDNIHAIWGDVDEREGTLLRPESMDFVFIVNTLFQTESPESALREAYRVLKKGGKLILVDWLESFRNMGPHKYHVLPKEEAKKILETLGFSVERELKNAGEHHYGFVAIK